MKSVLVTGATGFIGRHTLSLLLEKGYEVHAVTSAEPLADAPVDVQWHTANLLKSEDIDQLLQEVKPAHLLHFAWIATPGVYWTSPENEEWLEMGKYLFEEFVKHGGERIVGAGTCAEHNPSTAYGQSKLALQEALGNMDVSSAWGRIFYLYGPHEHPNRLASSVIQSLLKKERVACSHGKQIRDFLYVEDVASAFVALLESTVTGPVDIGSGEDSTVGSIIEVIAQQLDGMDSIDWGALPVPEDDIPRIVADVHRLQDEVQWSPSFLLDDGLKRTIRWWNYEINH